MIERRDSAWQRRHILDGVSANQQGASRDQSWSDLHSRCVGVARPAGRCRLYWRGGPVQSGDTKQLDVAKAKVGATDTDGDNKAILATDSGRGHPGARRKRVFFLPSLVAEAGFTAKGWVI
jgi:hypothetical protein